MTGFEYYTIIGNTFFNLNGAETDCDKFVIDVMRNCGVEFPNTRGCGRILTKLNEGFSYWTECSYQQAQAYANCGYPAIAIEEDYAAMTGHVVAITPNGKIVPNKIQDVHMSMTGYKNILDGTIAEAWRPSKWSELKFFFYNHKCSESNCSN